ncbi:MAG: cytidine deaminase [Spirochaetales bacterium]|nr:cytidine deaminase [Spirochaetales bacterium]
MSEISKEKLVEEAWNARENSHSPYSQFKVGAAVQGIDGNIYHGANIENISYGATVCAERTAIFNMIK